MWSPEKERRQFELVWEFVWPAFASVFGLILGGCIGGALGGFPKAIVGALVGGLIAAEAGHVLGCLLLLIFRPWIDFCTSGDYGPLAAGFVAAGLIAACALPLLDDAGLAIFLSCLGFSLGDSLFLGTQVVLGAWRKPDPGLDG
jgi:hypothetical protein